MTYPAIYPATCPAKLTKWRSGKKLLLLPFILCGSFPEIGMYNVGQSTAAQAMFSQQPQQQYVTYYSQPAPGGVAMVPQQGPTACYCDQFQSQRQQQHSAAQQQSYMAQMQIIAQQQRAAAQQQYYMAQMQASAQQQCVALTQVPAAQVPATTLAKKKKIKKKYEYEYHCETCSLIFNVSSNLKRHTRIHSGEKPYGCTHCKKYFANSSNRKTHEKVCLRKIQKAKEEEEKQKLAEATAVTILSSLAIPVPETSGPVTQ